MKRNLLLIELLQIKKQVSFSITLFKTTKKDTFTISEKY